MAIAPGRPSRPPRPPGCAPCHSGRSADQTAAAPSIGSHSNRSSLFTVCDDGLAIATVHTSHDCKSKGFSVESHPMKKTLRLCILVALCFGGAARAWAVADPGDRFLEAYFLIQEGDTAVRDSDWTKANTKYGGALDILNEVKTDSPDWNPHIIEFRTKYINDHLSEVKAKLALSTGIRPQPQPPATTTETPPVVSTTAASNPPPTVSATDTNPAPTVSAITTNPATAVESEQVRQLTSELQRAHEQVEQLEAARNELNVKLQEQLSKVAPTQTTPQIEELIKTNQDLTARLAAAQNDIAGARDRAADRKR